MQKRIKSVVPIYGMAAVFLAYCFIFPMWRFADLAIGLGVAVLGFFALGKLFPGKIIEVPREVVFEKTGDAAADAILTQGREYIRRLGELGEMIDDEGITKQIVHLQEVSEDIFGFIAKNPGHARKINTFMDYYYPTAMKFLQSYADLCQKAVIGENISATLVKISASLVKIEEAFEHQLDSLYSDKALDITTDIAVLENIMKREGL
ncbi:MAG: 5-bromo-4-chloroindolyl phosphate hydrolysis family protein [Defluviitaleaceae bacterium]|nr:5-bromo-4-chloroindolyl phosphate hydrolysis family protein [Defluviitaleaceae bacterium]